MTDFSGYGPLPQVDTRTIGAAQCAIARRATSLDDYAMLCDMVLGDERAAERYYSVGTARNRRSSTTGGQSCGMPSSTP